MPSFLPSCRPVTKASLRAVSISRRINGPTTSFSSTLITSISFSLSLKASSIPSMPNGANSVPEARTLFSSPIERCLNNALPVHGDQMVTIAEQCQPRLFETCHRYVGKCCVTWPTTRPRRMMRSPERIGDEGHPVGERTPTPNAPRIDSIPSSKSCSAPEPRRRCSRVGTRSLRGNRPLVPGGVRASR